ncbi:hypothetical protein JCM6882_003075 [Rhodosporidiobolus microsporus]
MNKQEVLTIKKRLKTTNDADEIVDLLQQLEDKVVASQSLLSDTKIGVVVGSLKAHASPEVVDLATAIVKKWKGEVRPAKPMKEKLASGQIRASSSLPSPTDEKPRPIVSLQHKKTKPPSPPSAKTASPVQHTPPSPVSPPPATAARTCKTDAVDFNYDSKDATTSVRVKCCELLYDVLAGDSDASAETLCKVVLSVEKAAWLQNPPKKDEDGQTASPAYRTKMRQLYLSLKKATSAPLRLKVVEGELAPEKLVALGSMDLASEEQRAEHNKILALSLKSATVQANEEPGSYKDEAAWHAKGR